MKLTTLTWTAAATAATATAGAVATDPDSGWYLKLRKPDWQPPAMAPAILAVGGGSYSVLYAVAGTCAILGAGAITRVKRVR